MTRHICIIISMLYSLSAYAASVSPFFSIEQKRKSFSISAREYQDSRIDPNSDGKVERWNIEKGPLKISISYLKDRTIYTIIKYEKTHVAERIVVARNGKLFLVKSQNRKEHIYYQSSPEIMCIANHESQWKKMNELFLKVTEGSLMICADKYQDKTCSESDFGDQINESIREVYRPPNTSEDSKNEFLSCLESNAAKEGFERKYGKEQGQTEHLQSIVNYKNKIVKFLNSPTTSAVISCKELTDKSDAAKASESGKIQLILDKNRLEKSEISDQIQSFKIQLFHETIHTSKVESEDLVTYLTKLCAEKIKTEVSELKVVGSDVSGSTFVIDSTKAAETASLKASDVIPASIAEAPKPLPPSGSPQEMNRVAEALGSEQTLKISQSQTSGVIKMAESVLASTPAVAAPVSNTIASTTSKSSSSRLPASEPTYSPNTKAPSNPALKNLQKNSTSGKAREYITEEIDLTKQQMVGSTASSASANRVAQAANSKATTASTSVGAPEVSTSTDTPTASTGSSRGNLNASGAGGGSISTGNTRTNNRGVASSGAASSQNEVREEIASSFLDKPYQEARKQLKNRAFVETLERNDITVYDLQGQSFGAPKGKIIFIDKGNRFDRKTRP
ncbi:MAG: hypothetical protein HUU57_04925 [Bdellovibrio sp.]|nr:hypothetical protein [Bdellovibrio sp.]